MVLRRGEVARSGDLKCAEVILDEGRSDRFLFDLRERRLGRIAGVVNNEASEKIGVQVDTAGKFGVQCVNILLVQGLKYRSGGRKNETPQTERNAVCIMAVVKDANLEVGLICLGDDVESPRESE